ncbi:tRNA lysidine(34) synthetase TilS [Mycoavidus sp. HKI]|uniref:tRNA lysidine(34) synthetase TilS n=1 Tax=Mycoavidus sp. HKI TaxID=2840467 RepID=UPI001CBB325E|nr:tRNA lysidine(34) synthetase TilS [Mycoavidus sp. HKI]UAW63528.1 tRNA lysidine(34) synthetase TilS [Mycoavidus sp. HKI]
MANSRKPPPSALLSVKAAEIKPVAQALSAALLPLHVNQTLAIAFSGGLDSTVLLHAAISCVGAEHCVALHIHHGLSPHADAWLAHCDALAAQFGVRFAARQIEINRKSGRGLEAAARDLRYAALDELCQVQQAQLLLLGHHADDQAETVLLQLLRGTGIAGLAAMPVLKEQKKSADSGLVAPALPASNLQAPPGAQATNRPSYMRPLLNVPRAALTAYARHYNLRWLEDESNTDLRYTRNALRHAVLPQIGAYFPAYQTALARAARHAADAQTLLDELAQLDLQRIAVQPNAYVLSHSALIALNQEHTLRTANVIRYWLRLLGLPAPSNARLDNLLKQLCAARADATIQLEHAGYQLRVYRDKVWWERTDRPQNQSRAAGVLASDANVLLKPSDATLHWSGQTAWPLVRWRGTLLFIASHSHDSHELASVPAALLHSAPLRASLRQGGERMRQLAPGPRRTLKNLFQEAGIPAWQRDVPCIYVGDRLLFVPYIGLNYEIPQLSDLAEAERVHLAWQPDPKSGTNSSG